ncbi:hypothetical protein [Streptomyces avermitilis]|uniref:hypothetical protein n=1 Tax=Streptomyces avermitilis TaxID=33903 RepID=UPI0033AC496A
MTQLDHPVDSSSTENAVPPRFGMAQALVILGFLTAAVVLHLVAHTDVQDTVTLLSAAGGMSVAVLLAAGFHHNRGRGSLLQRLLNAALNPGSGS